MKKSQDFKFVQTSQERLEVHKGGGCIGCFGIPFFLAGIFMLLSTFQIIPFSNAKEVPWYGYIILFFMGLVFTAVGSGLVFGRKWVTIDKTRRRIFMAWGLLRPMKGEQYDLNNYISILLKHNPGDSDTAESFPVALKATDGRTELELNSYTDYGLALEQAMLLSAFLNLKLEDISTDNPIEIKPQDIREGNASLMDKKPIEISAQPLKMKSQVSESADELQILLPGQPFHKSNLIGILIPLVILFVVGPGAISFFQRTNTPDYVTYFFGGFIGLFFILLPIIEVLKAYIRSRSFLTEVIVSSKGISMHHKTTAGKNSIILASQDILSIDFGTRETAITSALKEHEKSDRRFLAKGGVSVPYAPLPRWISWLHSFSRSKGVIIKSKKGIFSFAAGLPDEEVYHLYTLVLSYLKT